MKQLILTVIILLTGCTLKASPGLQTMQDNISNAGYSLEILPDLQNKITLVRFNIPEDAIVKITMSDEFNNVIQVLADGEMDKGIYCIYFNTEGKSAERKLVCRMEVTDKESADIIYSREIVQAF